MPEASVEVPQTRVPLFTFEDTKCLFYNKMIVLIGDSVVRAMYKDLVALLKGMALSPFDLRQKGEESFMGDELIEGGKRELMHNGKNYREVRQFQTSTTLVRFYFVTRVYNRYVETVLADFKTDPKPDVVIMGSCLWDITRYGPNGISEYDQSLEDLFRAFKIVLPSDTMLIWSSALPVGIAVTGGVILENIKFMGDYLRLDVIMANFLASKAIRKYSYDMIDFHSVFRHKVEMRLGDGIHWNEHAHRRMTLMLMDHIRLAWNIELPIEDYVCNLRDLASNNPQWLNF